MFSKVEIDPDLRHHVSCFSKCHGELLNSDGRLNKDYERVKIENCHLQLFKYSSKEHEALASIVYQENYDEDDDD